MFFKLNYLFFDSLFLFSYLQSNNATNLSFYSYCHVFLDPVKLCLSLHFLGHMGLPFL